MVTARAVNHIDSTQTPEHVAWYWGYRAGRAGVPATLRNGAMPGSAEGFVVGRRHRREIEARRAKVSVSNINYSRLRAITHEACQRLGDIPERRHVSVQEAYERRARARAISVEEGPFPSTTTLKDVENALRWATRRQSRTSK